MLVAVAVLTGCAEVEHQGPHPRPQVVLPDGVADVRLTGPDNTTYNGLGVGTQGSLYLAIGEYRPAEVVDLDQERFEGADLLHTDITVAAELDRDDAVAALTFSMGEADFEAEFDGVGFQVDCFEMDPPDDTDVEYVVWWDLVGRLADGTALTVTFSGSEKTAETTGLISGATVRLAEPLYSVGVTDIELSR